MYYSESALGGRVVALRRPAVGGAMGGGKSRLHKAKDRGASSGWRQTVPPSRKAMGDRW